VVAGEQPVEQGGAGAADMQESGGEGAKRVTTGCGKMLALKPAFLLFLLCDAMDERP
jgi:hypothetical protein